MGVLLQGLGEGVTAAGVVTVMLLLVLLVFFVFPLVECVQSAFSCWEQREEMGVALKNIDIVP